MLVNYFEFTIAVGTSIFMNFKRIILQYLQWFDNFFAVRTFSHLTSVSHETKLRIYALWNRIPECTINMLIFQFSNQSYIL